MDIAEYTFLGKKGYHLYTYILYLFLGLPLFYLYYKLLKNKIDEKLYLYSIPIILAGVVLRTYVDFGYIPYNFFTVTPGIWLWYGFLIYLLLRKFPLEKLSKVFWVLLVILLFPLIFKFKSLIYFFYWLYLYAPLVLIFYLFFKGIPFYIASALLLDTTASIINVHYKGYYEEHLLSRILLEKNPILFLLIRLILIFLITLYAKKRDLSYLEKFLLFFIFILGLAPGFRNFLILFA